MMEERFESGVAFAIPDLYPKSSLTDPEVEELAPGVDLVSPFSTSHVLRAKYGD